MTMGEQLIQKGIQHGVQLGAGRALIHLLEQKFAVIPSSYRERIEQAAPETLLKWMTRLLKAKAIEEVFQ